MVIINEKLDLKKVDFSFVPSLKCNLECSFCSYKAGPHNKSKLRLNQAGKFLKTVDWKRIYSWGFYGGEPSINLEMYQAFIDLIPNSVPMFVITNGTWSNTMAEMNKFLDFVWHNKLFVVVSGTEEHKRYQNANVLKLFDGISCFKMKGDDIIHPMGRAYKPDWTCSKKCLTHPQPIRLAMFPAGYIALQNCDGVYPIVGHYEDSFDKIFDRAVKIRKRGCDKTGLNINNIL